MGILRKRTVKKTTILICTAMLVAVFGGCNTADTKDTSAGMSETADAEKDYSNQTVIGKVTAIEGAQVTLQLGEMNIPNMKEDLRTDDGNKNDPGDGQTVPDKSGGERPERSQIPFDGDKEERDKEAAPDSGESDGRKGNGGFTPGEETLSVDLERVTIMMNGKGESTEAAFEDIGQDDILSITFGENGTVESVVLRSGNAVGRPSAPSEDSEN